MAIDTVLIRTPHSMQQVTQNFRSGILSVVEVPIPQLKAGGVLVHTMSSVVSAGTERSKVVLAKKNLLGKALARPDQVHKVIAQVKRDGIQSGLAKAFNKLNAYSPMGYSAAGVVVGVGEGVSGVVVGDRVACGGAGYANHAEYVFVPKNLVVPIPDSVDYADAAFATVGAIALQGVRQADVHIGERVAVVGLGLMGLLSVQLLRASGCVVTGIEPNTQRCRLAESLGAHRALSPENLSQGVIRGLTQGMGFDVVVITAASASRGFLAMAAELLRDRGRVVVVGDVPLEAPREIFYRKEIELRLSRSYGPGRYDRQYEEGGHDYPIGYVRWTEQRNMSEILRLIADGRLNLKSLVSHRLPIDQVTAGYEALKSGQALSIVLDYVSEDDRPRSWPWYEKKYPAVTKTPVDSLGVSVIGAGSYMGGVLMPILRATKRINLRGVISAGGLSAEDFRRRHGFAFSTGDLDDLMQDPTTAALMIATSHREHGRLVHEALGHQKAVFVEKPLAITDQEVRVIAQDLKSNPRLMVGYNRRFSRHTRLLKDGFGDRAGAALVTMRVNAGAIDREHWIQDKTVGGGRIIGEVCHFVDLAQALTGSQIQSVFSQGPGGVDYGRDLEDNVTAVLSHADGSISTIIYTAKGDPTVGKERIEMFADGIYGEIDDFKKSILVRGGKTEVVRGTDKGQRAELEAWLAALRTGGEMPIPPFEQVMSAVATLAVIDSLHAREPRSVRMP